MIWLQMALLGAGVVLLYLFLSHEPEPRRDEGGVGPFGSGDW